MKKINIFLTFGVLVIILLCGCNLFKAQSDNKPASELIPASAALIIETDNVSELFEQIKGQDYAKIVEESTFKRISQLNEQAAAYFLENTATFISFHKLSSNDYGVFIVSKIDDTKNDLTLNEFVDKSHDFKGTTIYKYSKDTEKYYGAIVNQNLLFSDSPILIEESILVSIGNQEGIATSDSYKEVFLHHKQSHDAALYINVEELPQFASIFVLPKYIKEDLQKIKTFGHWLEFDLDFNNDEISMSGFTYFDKNQTANTLALQTSDKSYECLEALPNNTAFLQIKQYDNARVHFDSLSKKELIKFPFSKFISPWMGNETSFSLNRPFNKNIENEAIITIEMVDESLTKSVLDSLEIVQQRENFREEYKALTIYSLKLEDGLQPIYPLTAHFFKTAYAVIIENRVVFSPSQSTIEIIIDKVQAGQTLKYDDHFLRFYEQISAAAHQTVYFDVNQLNELAKVLLKKEFAGFVKNDEEGLQKLSQWSFQFTGVEGKLFTNAFVKYNKAIKNKAEILWKTKLEGKTAIQPKIIRLSNKNSKEIVVQDSLQNLYLIDKSGNILWKRNIDGFVISDFYEVDINNNGQHQILFNTPQKVYVLDKKGKDVNNFPMLLRSNATNGLLKVDYEGKNDFRFFVACDNNNIYGFQRSGKPLSGWNPQMNVGKVTVPIKHLFHNKLDYLFAITIDGKLNIYDKRGEKRFETIPLEGNFKRNVVPELKTNPALLIVTNTVGKTFKINLQSGTVASEKLINSSVKDFVFAPIQGDEYKEKVFLTEREIVVYEGKRRVFSYDLLGEKTDKIYTISTALHDRIAFMSSKSDYTYMIDDKGQLLSGFPLQSSVPFSVNYLFNNTESIFIGGEGNYVYAHRL